MLRILFVRHGQSQANVTGTLAGRQPGVELSDAGREQAAAIGSALARVPLVAIVASPIARTVATAGAIAKAHEPVMKVSRDQAFTEIDFGDWSGRKLAGLAHQPLWKQVHTAPSMATFPHGESMTAVSHRSVAGLDKLIAKYDNPKADVTTIVVVSHADVIKLMLAHAMGIHLDLFQRIQVDPGSTSALAVGAELRRVEFMNMPTSGLAEALRLGPQDSAPGGTTGTPGRAK